MDFKNKVVVCIDGGMTRNMIYHNDFGWTLERRADGTHHRETLI